MSHPAPTRLVVVLQDLASGDTQRYALHLARGLDRRWFAPELWVLGGGDGFHAAALDAGVPVVRLTEGSRVGPLAVVRLALRLRRERPDLLYTLTGVPNVWGGVFAALLRIPVVSGFRSFAPRHERVLKRFSRRIVTNAEGLRDRLTREYGLDGAQVTVIPDGVDCGRFQPDDARRAHHPLVVCVARLVPEMDIPTLLEAFHLTRLQIPEARLDVIGDGPVPEPCPPNVRFLRGTEDVLPRLQSAWVFALASGNEAAPDVLLEAMACALPVVATRVGGIPEVVEDGVTGALVEPRDPAAMSRALTDLLRNRERRRLLGEAGRKHAEARFGLADMVHATEAVLREVAEVGATWTTTATGETPPEIPLPPPPDAARSPEVVVERGRFRPDRSVRDVRSPTLTAFLPPQSLATGAAVIVCPGGGYAAITIDREGYEVGRWLASRGIAGLVLKYRIPPAAARWTTSRGLSRTSPGRWRPLGHRPELGAWTNVASV